MPPRKKKRLRAALRWRVNSGYQMPMNVSRLRRPANSRTALISPKVPLDTEAAPLARSRVATDDSERCSGEASFGYRVERERFKFCLASEADPRGCSIVVC